MYIIAEIGSNWDGDIQLAKDHIDHCIIAGVDAIKFQLWRTDIVYPNNPENKKWEMDFDTARKIYHYAHNRITCFFTPSYPEAVDFCEEIKVPMYKIASVTSALKHPLAQETMDKVAATGKPTFISHGYNQGGKSKDMDMFCIPKYPATWEDYIDSKFRGTYGHISDHTIGTNLMYWWAGYHPNGAIEKHVKLQDNSSPDSPFSLYTQELADFITLSKSSIFKLG